MISMDEARARVARGAAHLDQVKPGWHERIDVGTLTLWDPCGCVVGQLTNFRRGDDFYEKIACNLALPMPPSDDFWEEGRNQVAAEHGFDLTYDEYEFGSERKNWDKFASLQEAWIEAIADRLHPVTETNGVKETLSV